ncbi:methyltransferase domain-containing protein [Amylibacter sp.]|nr:methyltransferase domain-containing protein [Amylibacter sp.]
MKNNKKKSTSEQLAIKRIDLKPAGSVEKYNVLLQNDIKDFMFTNKNMDKISCPVCCSTSSKLFGEKYNFNHVACNECGFIFVNPRPSPKDMENYYANSKASAFFQTDIIAPTEENRIRLIVKPRLKYINEKYSSKGKWLDIGCSSATLLSEAKKTGWSVVGLDFEKTAIAIAESKGVPMLKEPVETLGIESEYDLITLFEVLEHLSNPKEVLEACYRALNDGGSIVITVPNIEGFEFETLGMVHSNICPPSHLNYFSPSTLGRMLSEVGYELTDIETPGYLDVDNVRTAMMKGIIETTGNNFLDEIVTSKKVFADANREKLQQLVSTSGKSGHLRICAKKNG